MAELAAIILAAGQGTRMRSRLPKVLHPVGGRPMIQHVIRNAVVLGADPIVLVVGAGREAVEQAVVAEFGRYEDALRFAHQAEQKGTADAVACGLHLVGDRPSTVLILYGDVPNLTPETLDELLRARERSGAALAMVTFEPGDPTGYGRIARDADGHVTRIVEHGDCSPPQLLLRECNAGVYAVDRTLLEEQLSTIGTGNAQRELYLTDIVAVAARPGGRSRGVVAVEAAADEVAGVNDRVDLADANRVFRTRRNRVLMEAGVTLIDPDTTYVDSMAWVDADVVLHPGVVLMGRTSIGAGTEIHPYSVLHDATVGKYCSVGPYARLRPGTVLADRVKIGNFVETKKAVIGEGSKANHLAYLGDTTIGEHSNIGAGTITCNYDGERKHPTFIGSNAFIGSNVQLVAPVQVGDDAYVGAGTTVTQDVPDGALALSRVEQRNIDGYAERRKARKKKRTEG